MHAVFLHHPPKKTLSKPFLKVFQCLAVMVSVVLAPALADEYTDVSQLMRSGKSADALAKIELHLVTKPRDPQMRFFKGLIQRDQGKAIDAINTFTTLTEDYPEIPEPYNNLAVLFAAQNQFEKARAALEMAIRNNPTYAVAYENLGDVHARLAAQAYDKALQLDSTNTGVPPKLALAKELFSRGAKASPNGSPSQK